ncbi:hypothetical protein [Rathayibacter sp. VKM Ac-2630]|uniref:hypothetical protein n=1 Tax=Rathayibacter sp. VKM Ac-2630 TaxID=1938617 RepID=UPI0009D07080|nr:hypothetical protein [Rathayibacter sp. VKM Ac-2630]OOB90764.1 hypothetical protein B0T42_10175 [Rathayibacter sp. VKM Ac-2630]
MALVYGTLTDLTDEPLNDQAVRLRFVPSGPGVAGGRLLSKRPIEVDVGAGGVFAVEVFSTMTISPEMWFTVEFSRLVAGEAPTYERLPFKLRVPDGGGRIGDLVAAPAPPAVIGAGLGEPDRDYPAYIDLLTATYYERK